MRAVSIPLRNVFQEADRKCSRKAPDFIQRKISNTAYKEGACTGPERGEIVRGDTVWGRHYSTH